MGWLNSISKQKHNSGFTLVELLIVITIIAILAGLSAAVLSGAATDAKIARTKAQISRINLLLLEKWESYESRQLQIKPPVGTSPLALQTARLWGMRDLIRMEMPDRKEDVTQAPVGFNATFPFAFTLPQPSLRNRYQRRAVAGWTRKHEGAECLYLILDGMQDEFGSVLEHFKSSEIGDVDGDGMKEVLDAWGNPIEFIRWPTGYLSPIQEPDPIAADPFDPFKRDTRTVAINPHVIIPLVYSAGANGEYGLIPDNTLTQKDITAASTSTYTFSYQYDDPYLADGTDMLGSPLTSANGAELDNIDNHFGVVE